VNIIIVYVRVSDESVIPGAFEFSNPYWNNFELASVSLHPFTGSEEWGVTVSGSDDGGLCYVAPNRELAFEMFTTVLQSGDIDVDVLVQLGFKDADSI
jgi:hypothetical protein